VDWINRRSQDLSVQTAGNSAYRQATRSHRWPRSSSRSQRSGKPRLFARRVRPATGVLAVRRPASAAGGAVPPEPRRFRRRQRSTQRRARSDGRQPRPGVALQPG